MDDEMTRIHVAREGELAVITLDGRKKRNALGRDARGALLRALTQLQGDPQVRALVLTGAGGHFCAGADVSQFTKSTVPGGRFNIRESGAIVRLLASGAKPVVAAVEGTAFGMGLSLAVACDLVVAARDARLCPVFARVGLVPDTGIFWTLPNKIGLARARSMLSLAQEVGGEQALEMGIVDRLGESGTALEIAKDQARRLASLAPMALALTKSALTWRSGSLEECLRAEQDLQPMLLQSRDHREAIRARAGAYQPDFLGN